ncbi:MAG TPA: N-acetylmuramoyl-L-alanine amidase [Candidatus Cybelea sp.]|nr:N-acetylmuramoyl-L-alanine amidase [Candidatus Cybelea sp.]
MSWINRFTVRIFKLLAAVSFAFAAAAPALPARADAAITALYGGRTIRFTHVSSQAGAPAIGVFDPGLAALLRDAGAVLTWRPGERYVLVTNSVPVVISFALGDRRYDVGPIALQANTAPFVIGDEAYLPMRELLRSLDLALRQDGPVAVLQPQLSSFDLRQQGGRATMLAHAGAVLHARVVAQTPTSISYAFDGVGTTLSGSRPPGGVVRSITIASSGTVRAPVTTVTIAVAPGAIAQAPQNPSGHDVLLTIDGPVTANASEAAEAPAYAAAVPGASPTPEPEPGAQSAGGPAQVTGVTVQQGNDGITVAIAIGGDASYQWHRLREPDNRFWVDIENAQLQGAAIEQSEAGPLLSMRVRQVDPTTVRIALSLSGPKDLTLTPSASGLGIAIATQNVSDALRSGSGSVGSVVASAASGPAVTPAPLDQTANDSSDDDSNAWKFGPRSGYVANNPRLIVIDPGHGGSDPGTAHGGVSEAQLTLDMAKRLRDLLVALGWQVKMTRDTDVDVYQPNDSARDELQARDDVANKAGARMFISIHVNGFINSGPYGTTTYISKSDDVALARAIERHLSADGTKDDGIVKSHLYVTLHAKMPAALVETAFLTNPSDYALLTSAAWRQKVAQEIADGIGQYAREYPVTGQPAQ